MEEKQNFQLRDTFYLVFRSDYDKKWNLRKETVSGIEQRENEIYLKSTNTMVLQRLCAHTLAEAKEIAIKNFCLECKGQVKSIRDLKE